LLNSLFEFRQVFLCPISAVGYSRRAQLAVLPVQGAVSGGFPAERHACSAEDPLNAGAFPPEIHGEGGRSWPAAQIDTLDAGRGKFAYEIGTLAWRPVKNGMFLQLFGDPE
jgi:hypothetical protein